MQPLITVSCVNALCVTALAVLSCRRPTLFPYSSPRELNPPRVVQDDEKQTLPAGIARSSCIRRPLAHPAGSVLGRAPVLWRSSARAGHTRMAEFSPEQVRIWIVKCTTSQFERHWSNAR